MSKPSKFVIPGLGLAVATAAVLAASVVNAQTLSPAQEGRRAWLKYNCYGCHGMRAAGGMGPNVQHEGGEVGEAVREGEEEGMPSYRRILTATEIANLRAYLNSIGKPGEPTFMHWWEPVPSK